MKKALFTLLLGAVISFSASAQKQTRIGAFLGYGTEIDNICLGALGEFMINEKIGISPSLVFYFPKDDVSVWELNGNLNYYFYSEGNVSLYGIGGLNLSGVKYDYDFGPGYEGSDSSSEFGLNLGMGSNFSISNDKILPFAEIKYVISDFDHLAIFAGVKFNIN